MGIAGGTAYQSCKEFSQGDALGGTIVGGVASISGSMAITDGMKGWDESQKTDACASAKFKHLRGNAISSLRSSTFKGAENDFSSSSCSSMHPSDVGVEEYNESSNEFGSDFFGS